ncbi:MAG TPA: phage portal protein [Phyllobacterium sp.]|nr:phage portal protein [Phyllobacterium sp.]
MPNLIQRMAGYMGIGPWRSSPGPYSSPAMPTDEGWIPCAWPINFGQVAYDPIPGGVNSVVYACISLYARTIAQLPGQNKEELDNGGTRIIKNTGLARVLKKPNAYQTRSDFMFNLVFDLLGEGNAYALAQRNDRTEVSQLHLLNAKATVPMIAEDGSVFYSIGGNPMIDPLLDPAYNAGARWVVPARDVMHIRCRTPRHPLIGEPPVTASMIEQGIYNAATVNMNKFFGNQSKPSGVLQTKATLTAEQVKILRERWMEQTTGANIGGVPILTNELEWKATMMNAQDTQLIESLKLARQQIAACFGVPLALIDDMTGATWNNVEQLTLQWKAQGLAYYVNHIELAFDQLGEIELTDQYTEFDMTALDRPDFKTRIEALARATQGGIYSPNEARRTEGLPAAANGDEPRVQQQMVPLSYEIPEPAAAAAPPPPPTDDTNDNNPPPDDAAAGKAIKLSDEYQVALANSDVDKIFKMGFSA